MSFEMCSVWCLFVNGKEFVSFSRFFAVFSLSSLCFLNSVTQQSKRECGVCAHAHSHFLTPFSNSECGRFYVHLIVLANGSMVIISLTQSQRLKSILTKNAQYYPKQCKRTHTHKKANNGDTQLTVAMSAKLIFQLKRNQFTTAFSRFLLNTLHHIDGIHAFRHLLLILVHDAVALNANNSWSNLCCTIAQKPLRCANEKKGRNNTAQQDLRANSSKCNWFPILCSWFFFHLAWHYVCFSSLPICFELMQPWPFNTFHRAFVTLQTTIAFVIRSINHRYE